MNILIIGLGSIGKKHVLAIRKVRPNAYIYALRSVKADDVYEGVQNIYSYKEISTQPDFIIIANPTQLHGDTIKECIRFNCPLFIEKPVLSDLQNSSELIELLKNKNIITYVACNMRFHPALLFIKSYLEANTLRVNEVNIYCGSYLPDWRPGRDFRNIYSANRSMGGGVHLDLVHEIDYCLWLFGNPGSVTAVKRSVSDLKIDAVDYAQFNLLYPGFTAGITLNYYRRDAKRSIEIVAENDTLQIDLIKNMVSSNTTGTVLFQKTFNMSDTYINQLDYFLNEIENKRKPMNDISEGVDVLKIALDA